MKKVLLAPVWYISGLLLYIITMLFMFMYLVFNPSKMNIFFCGIKATMDYMEGKAKPKEA